MIAATRPVFALRHMRGMIPRLSAHGLRKPAKMPVGYRSLAHRARTGRSQRTLVRSEKACSYQACSMCDASPNDPIPSYPGLDLVSPMIYGSRGRFNWLSYGAKIQYLLFEPQSAAMTSDCIIDCSVELKI
jgi:hypothetical protein